MAITAHPSELGPSSASAEDMMFSDNLHEMLSAIDPDLWAPAYGQYNRDTQLRRLDMIHAMVGPDKYQNPAEYLKDAAQTYDFVDRVFDVYEGKTQPEAEGSFAFVVPSRIERKASGEFDDYAPEANQHMPLLAYVDSATRQNFMAGLCPFVIDKYGVDPDGKRGYMVFAPLLGDIVRDLEANDLLDTVDKVINDTTDFAKSRLGVSMAGLGAILPRLTDMGRNIRTPDLITTTGHGGTVALILRTLERGYDQGLTRDGMLRRIGIIGSGAIGAATADVILAEGLTNLVTISDRNEERLGKVVGHLRRKYPWAHILGTTDNVSVVNTSDAVVSAVTTQFDLDSEEWKKADVDGLYLVDDSQPGAFNPQQFESKGGNITWVMGHDNTPGGLVTLESFDYVGTGPASQSDIFGCQGEVAAIYLADAPEAAINTEVTPEQALCIDSLFTQVGISPAAPQRLGEYNKPKLNVEGRFLI